MWIAYSAKISVIFCHRNTFNNSYSESRSISNYRFIATFSCIFSLAFLPIAIIPNRFSTSYDSNYVQIIAVLRAVLSIFPYRVIVCSTFFNYGNGIEFYVINLHDEHRAQLSLIIWFGCYFSRITCNGQT